MNDEANDPRSVDLVQARATIAQQDADLAELRRALSEQRLAADLRRSFTLAASSGLIAAPIEAGGLLEMIVRVAASVISSRAASLFLLDQAQQDLVFEVAIGPKAGAVEKFRVPLGHGVAGIVALTGQAMAVSNAQSDARHAADIAQSVGYLPQTILCVPLFTNDQVIGVLELLDKEGGASFSPLDIELLGLFANLAAITIEQNRVQTNLAALVGQLLAAVEQGNGDPSDFADRVGAFTRSLDADTAFRETLEIAQLVEEIAHRGEDERAAIRMILQGFAAYLRTQHDSGGAFGAFA